MDGLPTSYLTTIFLMFGEVTEGYGKSDFEYV
jgi:hypothetical protein